jgi:hypothetical protein
MTDLLERTWANEPARERAKVMLLTISGQWSVRDGYERLGLGRTRFQDLRRRMLAAAVASLEPGAVGRPRGPSLREPKRVLRLRGEVAELTNELSRLRTLLDLSESGVGAAVGRRKAQLDERRVD